MNVNNSTIIERFYDFTNLKKNDKNSEQKFVEIENKKVFDYIKKTEIDGNEGGVYLWH